MDHTHRNKDPFAYRPEGLRAVSAVAAVPMIPNARLARDPANRPRTGTPARRWFFFPRKLQTV